MDFRIKDLCIKIHHQENENTCTMGEKFVNNISDKGLVSRIYEEILQFNDEKTKN